MQLEQFVSQAWDIGPAEVLVRRIEISEIAPGSTLTAAPSMGAALTSGEHATWKSLDSSSSRQHEWLLGRLALKDVVRTWASERGQQLEPRDIEIHIDDEGAPFARCAALSAVGGSPVISLTHNSGVVVAAAADPGALIGIDIEYVNRRIDVVARALSAPEQAFVAAEVASVLDLLVAKEAATKALGVGLGGGVSRWPVVAVTSVPQGLIVEVTSITDLGLVLPVLVLHPLDTVLGICYVAPDTDAA
ncbi:MAG: 4'-phosphopantetheinyl transferase superfamily protein [Actinomycetota bacterium]|nr:4'-phosphopantetheinyl transferase superfamily protein [Actinomycetota bacterium]